MYDAAFGARDVDVFGGVAFLTYFPFPDDVKLLLALGIRTVYFFGEIDNAEAAEMLDVTAETDQGIEMIQISENSTL